jgi:hypothetical protein
MKTIAIIAGSFALLNMANAQWPPNTTVIGSDSGQFFVSAHGRLSSHSIDLAAGSDLITLEPALLAVSCERIKRELLHELNMPDQWQGKIFVLVHPARTAADPVTVYPEILGGNWDCRIDLPDAVDRYELVKAVVHACLLEIANRHATDRSTEVPEWLQRGMTRQLMGTSEIKLILPPPATDKNGWHVTRMTVDFSDTPHPAGNTTRQLNPLAEAAGILRTNEPLSFDDLSWPTEEQLAGYGADVYSSSAQLFLNQLLHLKNGPACLRKMLAELPDYLNWQLAFLDAFHGTFEKPLDVEKWWALELADFSGRDLLHLLNHQESSRQLDAVFQFPIEVQIGVAPPMRTDITFQTIIRGWSRSRQLQVLKAKIWELDVLRLRISPDFIPLLDQYRQVLQEYYQKRRASTRILADIGLLPDKSEVEAITQLDALDAKREELRRQPPTPVVSAGDTEPVAVTR